jgi:hypothetical protein
MSANPVFPVPRMKNEKITASGARNLNVCLAVTLTSPEVEQSFFIVTARHSTLVRHVESDSVVTASGITVFVVVVTALMFLLKAL